MTLILALVTLAILAAATRARGPADASPHPTTLDRDPMIRLGTTGARAGTVAPSLPEVTADDAITGGRVPTAAELANLRALDATIARLEAAARAARSPDFARRRDAAIAALPPEEVGAWAEATTPIARAFLLSSLNPPAPIVGYAGQSVTEEARTLAVAGRVAYGDRTAAGVGWSLGVARARELVHSEIRDTEAVVTRAIVGVASLVATAASGGTAAAVAVPAYVAAEVLPSIAAADARARIMAAAGALGREVGAAYEQWRTLRRCAPLTVEDAAVCQAKILRNAYAERIYRPTGGRPDPIGGRIG